MGKINREDMLELTRRMTLKRNCFDRIAGAYLDEEGFLDGTFNKHFQKLSTKDQKSNLEIAKTVPFSETNVQLREYLFEEAQKGPGSIWQLLMALRECGLKNDAALDVFYEEFGQKYRARGSYAVYFFHGSYDVPQKAQDKESLWESEEVYQFIICTVCPVSGDYEPGKPNAGSSSRRLRTGAEMATGSISFRRTGGLGKGWRRFSFPDKCYVVLLT